MTLPRINPGDKIRAPWLNKVAESINGEPFKKTAEKSEQPIRDNDAAENQPVDEIWTEIARTTDTVRVYDPDDDSVYVDVERAATINFRTPAGTTIQLRMSN